MVSNYHYAFYALTAAIVINKENDRYIFLKSELSLALKNIVSLCVYAISVCVCIHVFGHKKLIV